MKTLTIGQLINKLLDVPADKHHLPVLINTDQLVSYSATCADRYDLDDPISETNPFIIEYLED